MLAVIRAERENSSPVVQLDEWNRTSYSRRILFHFQPGFNDARSFHLVRIPTQEKHGYAYMCLPMWMVWVDRARLVITSIISCPMPWWHQHPWIIYNNKNSYSTLWWNPHSSGRRQNGTAGWTRENKWEVNWGLTAAKSFQVGHLVAWQSRRIIRFHIRTEWIALERGSDMYMQPPGDIETWPV